MKLILASITALTFTSTSLTAQDPAQLSRVETQIHKILSRRPTMVRCCTRLHCYGMIRKLDHILNLQTSRVIKASVI
jgi:hypothetical protein